jgi:hypothetical protein
MKVVKFEQVNLGHVNKTGPENTAGNEGGELESVAGVLK